MFDGFGESVSEFDFSDSDGHWSWLVDYTNGKLLEVTNNNHQR